MRGQQLVDLHAHDEPQHTADLRLSKLASAIALDGQHFESFAHRVLVGGDDLGRKGFWDVEGDLYTK